MAEPETFFFDSGGLLARMEDTRPALEDIGLILEAAGQDAIVAGGLGGVKWPQKYPRQTGPFLHLDAALSDLNRGIVVRKSRLDRGNPLQLGGDLLRGIKSRISGRDSVEVGVTGPASEYAGIHQHGGTTETKITDTAKSTYQRTLEEGDIRVRELVRMRMGFVLRRKTRKTRVHKRRFLSARESIDEIREAIIEHVEGQ